MTSLVRSSDLEITQILEAITSWLDGVFATRHTSHRKLLALEDDLRMVDEELTDLDRYHQGAFDATETIAAHQLHLRYQDLDGIMYAKWRSPAIRRSSLLALRGIHERYVGTIPAGREHTVIFEIDRGFRNQDFGGFIEAHRLESESRWVHGELLGPSLSLNVVEGPAWVHDLYRHLIGTSLRGSRLRERYVQQDANDWRREHVEGHFLGDAVAKPDPDTLDAALRLWVPDVPDSPYVRLSAAVEAAKLL